MKNNRSFIASLVFVLFCLMPMVALAQETGYRFDLGKLSAGEDPISSGITAIAQFKNEKGRLLEVAFQQEQAWVLWGPEFKLGRVNGLVAGSIGHFQGAPWVGPFLTLDLPLGKIGGQEVSIGTMQWPCAFIGREPRNWRNDGKPVNTEPMFIGYLASFNMSIGPIGLSYSKLNFLDDPWNTIPGVSFTQKVRKDISVTGSVSRNMNNKENMYYIGVAWKPTK